MIVGVGVGSCVRRRMLPGSDGETPPSQEDPQQHQQEGRGF